MAETIDMPKTSAGADSAEVDACRDIIAAHKAGDAKALCLAQKRFYEACYGDKDDEKED